jgi:tetratricopeptide (TPR) repeat protein
MKKVRIIAYSIFGALFVMTFAIAYVNKDKAGYSVPGYKERTKAVALSGEWKNAKAAIEGLLQEIRINSENNKAKLNLAQAYIQEGRITGNHAYYDAAAIKLLDDILEKETENFDALSCKAVVLLSQHHFSEALKIALKAKEINGSSAFIHGVLCDAYVELGDYKEAVNMADAMVAIRPDIRSYSRVSYLREIFGDIKGSIAAMKLAVSAGYPGLEQTEWARVHLGHLYEINGEVDQAEQCYQISLSTRPGYAYAYAGLSKVEKIKGNYKKSIAYMQQAQNSIKDFSFAEEMVELYRYDNHYRKSMEMAHETVAMLNEEAQKGEDDEAVGHYADRELANAYLKTYDYTKALEHAKIEYERRPNNIDVCETLAWVHFKRGEYVKANEFIDKALRTGSKNPELLYKAGLVKINSGEKSKGLVYLKQAGESGIPVDPTLAQEINKYLAIK